jgi:2-phospho-L-lactate/phosphoenolpyruvate guanylyltransferase
MAPPEREELARSMLKTVVQAASGLRVVIVAPETAGDVRRFALINGMRFLPEPEGGGLNGAVAFGFHKLTELGYERVAIVHSDLPKARDITWLAEGDDIVIVPDRSGKGTNAMALPAEVPFGFAFGPNSFDAHCIEARRLGHEPRVVFDLDGLSIDIDEPEDMSDYKTDTQSV